MDKTVKDLREVVKCISSGSILAVGGFGLCGIPEHTLRLLSQMDVKHLTCISNNAGTDSFGIGMLLRNHQVSKMYASYIGENPLFEHQLLSKQMDVELVPQGTLAERLRAAGMGIGGFYTKTGVGTIIAENKETHDFRGEKYILEEALHADFGLVKAWKADTFGNLIFRKTARNFNGLCAMAAAYTIAEVEEIVQVGTLDPDAVHLPGIFVHAVFKGDGFEKRIEKIKTRGGCAAR